MLVQNKKEQKKYHNWLKRLSISYLVHSNIKMDLDRVTEVMIRMTSDMNCSNELNNVLTDISTIIPLASSSLNDKGELDIRYEQVLVNSINKYTKEVKYREFLEELESITHEYSGNASTLYKATLLSYLEVVHLFYTTKSIMMIDNNMKIRNSNHIVYGKHRFDSTTELSLISFAVTEYLTVGESNEGPRISTLNGIRSYLDEYEISVFYSDIMNVDTHYLFPEENSYNEAEAVNYVVWLSALLAVGFGMETLSLKLAVRSDLVESRYNINLPEIYKLRLTNISMGYEVADTLFLEERLVSDMSDTNTDLLVTVGMSESDSIRMFSDWTGRAPKDKLNVSNILEYRDFIIPSSGITYIFEEEDSELESLTIREIHRYDPDRHYLYFVYKARGFVEDCYVLPISSGTGLYTTGIDGNLAMLSKTLGYLALGLRDEMIDCYTYRDIIIFSEMVLPYLGNPDKNEKIMDIMTKQLKDSFNIAVEGMEEIISNSTIEIPYHWKYKDKDRNELKGLDNRFNDSDVEKQSRDIFIAPFTRRLPSGWEPSESAIELSRKYKLDLEDNSKTIVRGHIRKM